MHRLQSKILLNSDKEEGSRYGITYHSKGNYTDGTSVTFTNNEYLQDSPLAIGMAASQVKEILGAPTSESVNQLTYDTGLPEESYGYSLDIVLSEGEEVLAIKCVFDK